MKLNENELYNQDNTILINKVKEYEDDLKILKSKKASLGKFVNFSNLGISIPEFNGIPK